MAEVETIDDADDHGKLSDPPLRCFTSSVHHLKASVIKFVGKIRNQKLNFLIDSGSTHCFLSSKLVKKLNLKLNQEIKRPVELASGNKSFTKGLIENLSFVLNDQNHTGNFYVIDMGVHDVIIGMDWLIENHVVIDCEERKISFKQEDGSSHTIKGEERDSKSLIISAMKLVRGLRQGCETFLIFANELKPEQKPELKQSENPPYVEKLIEEFKDVFPKDLPGMPPPRSLDHGIDLYPGTKPYSRAPYI